MLTNKGILSILGQMTNTAADAGMMKGLTAKNIRDSMTQLGLGHGSPLPGVPVNISISPFLPAEQPAIQVRDICLKDGTPLLGPVFLALENAWWKAEYGMRPVAFVVGGQVAVHPSVYALIKQAVKSVDEQMAGVMLGRQP